MKKPKAIVFDLDGVLIDATEWHYEALNDALKLFGYEITQDEHDGTYNGLPTVEKLRLLSERKSLPVGLHTIINSLKRKYTKEKIDLLCHPSHDKLLLLTALKKSGYVLACASNAHRKSVDDMLKKAEIYDFFNIIIGNDEGFKPKPSPDIYLEVFKRLKMKSREIAIVEDSPHGIISAKRSGARVIEVRGFDDVNLEKFIREKLL